MFSFLLTTLIIIYWFIFFFSESRGNPFLSESSKANCTVLLKSTAAQSPNLRCQRHSLPFRSLENTDLLDSSNLATMVCSENVEDTRHIHDHQPSHIAKVNQDSNSCPDVSSQSCSYQKVNFTRTSGKQLSTSTPNGLNQNVTRPKNCPLSVETTDCIYQNEENIRLDNSENNGVRIQTDPFTDHYMVEKEIGR